MKLKSAMLLLVPFLVNPCISFANSDSPDFMVKLFNNTSVNQPLHYSVTGEGHSPVEGMLALGDANGRSVVINGDSSSDKVSAEVVLKDMAGHVVWKESVSFYEKTSEFYSRTISLDSHYSIGTNTFPTIHTISYDIR